MTRPSPRRRTVAGFAGAAVLAGILAACGGSAGTPASVPATPAPTTRAVATPAPTAEPTTKPTPAPYELASSAYGYRMTLPGVSVATQALQPWDGESRIDSDGPYTDKVRLPDSILFFVYGAPTELALDDYAAQTQEQMVSWHACPATPSSATGLDLDGTPGRRHQMTCQGLFVQKLMAVRDGRALVVNMLAPPGTVDEASTLFEDLVAGMTWPAGS